MNHARNSTKIMTTAKILINWCICCQSGFGNTSLFYLVIGQVIWHFSHWWPKCASIPFLIFSCSYIWTRIARRFYLPVVVEVFQDIVSGFSDTTRKLNWFNCCLGILWLVRPSQTSAQSTSRSRHSHHSASELPCFRCVHVTISPKWLQCYHHHHHHHHHHVAPPARISLTLARHTSLSSIAYILYPHRAVVYRFLLVVLPLLSHVKGSTGVCHLLVRTYFSRSVLHVGSFN